ncbi:hypothetical protein MF406_07790 [Georgenia sp. TF02-10]|uniref:hypothetical protein n=1 Tax=Georgenia sp. TF02-10 TaxID=2917725 RepID=UPI001FA71EB7|nr:hypothetical protein [Georgenia sp. TF02-10]UNX56098.1 hypothetical protein MF406_07790 [Georgenia sp. TF02-10]
MPKGEVEDVPCAGHGEDPATEAVGPVFVAADLIGWLGVSRQVIDERVRRRDLLALRTSDGSTVYPEWQFDVDGAVLPGVGAALRALSQGGMDDLTHLLWFAGENPELGGSSAAAWLTEKRDPGAVVRAAQHTAAGWRR